jgi:hypothetical protein
MDQLFLLFGVNVISAFISISFLKGDTTKNENEYEGYEDLAKIYTACAVLALLVNIVLIVLALIYRPSIDIDYIKNINSVITIFGVAGTVIQIIARAMSKDKVRLRTEAGGFKQS